jgi:hypothetical protein
MERDLHFKTDLLIDMLKSLEDEGDLRLDPMTSRIMDAYPYSAVPSRHLASLNNDRQVYCMCAIDTFYLPYLTGGQVKVHSRCYQCRTKIQIEMEPGVISVADPRTIVIWDSAAAYDCPKTNFFCSEEHLQLWRDSAPDEPGKSCTISEAMERGRKAGERIQKTKAGLNEILWAPSDEFVCYCREVPKTTIIGAISRGASSVEEVAAETTACTGRWCKELNPRKRCCSTEIKALIGCYARGRL